VHRLTSLFIALLLFIPTSFAATAPSSYNTVGTTPPLPFTMADYNVAYLRISTFNKTVAQSIRPTMEAIAKAKPRGLIIDLRDNQGGDIDTVHALLESVLPKGTPYMRKITPLVRVLAVTSQIPVIKKSTPIVVLRNSGTVNEPDIVIYVMQKMRGAGVVEFTEHRSALKRKFKQNARMDNYRPIKEGVFFVTPDARVIEDEGAKENDTVNRAITLIREKSPYGETTPSSQR
jgi:hypothetical protein